MTTTATVPPTALLPALFGKLDDAGRQIHYMRELELPNVLGSPWQPRDVAAHFVVAARGVYSTAETFAKGQAINFITWHRMWSKRKMTNRERDLWRKLRQCRIEHEHGAGAGLIPYSVDISALILEPDPARGTATTITMCSRRVKTGGKFASYPR